MTKLELSLEWGEKSLEWEKTGFCKVWRRWIF